MFHFRRDDNNGFFRYSSVMGGGSSETPLSSSATKPPASHNKSPKEPSIEIEPNLSYVTFISISLGAVSAGMLGGVYAVTRREKMKIRKQPTTAMMVAYKALVYGTFLCVGTFGAVFAGISYFTPVKTPTDFAAYARGVGRKWFPPKELTESEKQQSEEVAKDFQSFVDSVWDNYVKEEEEKNLKKEKEEVDDIELEDSDDES